MPPRINPKKCDGCPDRAESRCEEVCPGDLMYVDEATGRAACRSAQDCWDCMSCVKVCPHRAIETRIPYQIGYHKATLRPSLKGDRIIWQCVDIHGRKAIYEYRNRLPPEE